MADEKKGILVYADWIDKFEELEDDEAGRLIKHFFRYVNDLNPIPPDRITKLCFVDIQNQLKRDLKKWEGIIEDRSTNGRLGNLKRWNLDLYNEVISEKLTISEAEDIAKGRKLSLPDSNTSGTIANIAVNDNVTVNDNVINKKVIPPSKEGSIDYNRFINNFNSFANRNFRVTAKVKSALNARLKTYTKAEIMKAVENAHKDKYHIENGFKDLTPEFILREEKLEKFLNKQMNLIPVTNNTYIPVTNKIDHSNR